MNSVDSSDSWLLTSESGPDENTYYRSEFITVKRVIRLSLWVQYYA